MHVLYLHVIVMNTYDTPRQCHILQRSNPPPGLCSTRFSLHPWSHNGCQEEQRQRRTRCNDVKGMETSNYMKLLDTCFIHFFNG